MNSSTIYLKACCFLILLLFIFPSCRNEPEKQQNLDPTKLEAAYESYQEKSVDRRRFKHAEVLHLVNNRKGGFLVEEIGISVEGKSIYQMSIGNGHVKVMLWSQMHGNESTATMALFDLFNFLEGSEDEFDTIRNTILSNLNIRFIPMVNPDGMDEWKRRNALDIDLNRDAVDLVSPEAIILKNARDTFSPGFGFNLHDQQVYYNVFQTAKPATISVLAPAYNYETEVNDVRQKAMQVIVGMNRILQETIPGQVGKYDDAFEPRAFGDNFQKWGTSTILIESGGYPNDPEKQFIRKLNFMIILNALYEIAKGSYDQYALEDYYAIPDNDNKLMDLILKNVLLTKNGSQYSVDLGIKRREADANANGNYFVNGAIDDIGDLSVYYGYEELDAEGLEVVEGKIHPETFKDISSITKENAMELLKEGYLAVRVEDAKDAELFDLPILVLKNAEEIPFGMQTGASPNFYLAENGRLKYAVVNGYLINLEDPESLQFRQRVM